MKNLVIAMAVLVSTTSVALSAEENIPEQTAAVEARSNIQENFAAACEKFVLSEKAQTACDTQTMPRMVKAGDRFRNVGIGAEFNALIRNL